MNRRDLLARAFAAMSVPIASAATPTLGPGGYTFKHLVDGQVQESDLIVMPAEAWRADPRSQQGGWSVVRDGGMVLALAVLPASPDIAV